MVFFFVVGGVPRDRASRQLRGDLTEAVASAPSLPWRSPPAPSQPSIALAEITVVVGGGGAQFFLPKTPSETDDGGGGDLWIQCHAQPPPRSTGQHGVFELYLAFALSTDVVALC